jgi:autotransporter-associated beta strand protein
MWDGNNVNVDALTGSGTIDKNHGSTNNFVMTVGVAGGSGTFSGVIKNSSGAGTVSLTKAGAGTQILSGANTYNGSTTVNAGTLLVNGTNSGTGTVTVASGAVFGGTGSNASAVIVNSGGVLQGGAGLASGTLSLGGNLTLSSGSTIQLALSNSGSSTLARSGGSWSFATNEKFTFLDLGATTGTYTLITGLASNPGEAGWTITNSGWVGNFSYNAGSINLAVTAVPEPGAWVSLLGGCGVLLGLRRRRTY